MSIDEAIAKYKEITNTDAICPAHCNISCDKCVQESEQLAEWLEELKCYKNYNDFSGYADKLYIIAFNNGYNKALNDFVEFASDMPTVETEYGEIRPMRLEEMAEQLKAGDEE